MDGLATTLAPFVGRVVTNRTGLSGLFDFELTWTPDQRVVSQHVFRELRSSTFE